MVLPEKTPHVVGVGSLASASNMDLPIVSDHPHPVG